MHYSKLELKDLLLETSDFIVNNFLDVEQKNPAVAKVEHTKQLMKKNWDLFVYEMSHCDRCVWQGNECPGPTPWKVPECPHGLKYKRDPPDGGYYG